MPMTGCYTLELWCDHDNPNHAEGQFPVQFHEQTYEACREQAIKAGWRIKSNSEGLFICTCPCCKTECYPLGIRRRMSGSAIEQAEHAKIMRMLSHHYRNPAEMIALWSEPFGRLDPL